MFASEAIFYTLQTAIFKIKYSHSGTQRYTNLIFACKREIAKCSIFHNKNHEISKWAKPLYGSNGVCHLQQSWTEPRGCRQHWLVCGGEACTVQCACLVWASEKPWRTAWASRLETPWAPYVFECELKSDRLSSDTSYDCRFLHGPHVQLGCDPQFKRQCCPGLSWEVDVLVGRPREFRWIGGTCGHVKMTTLDPFAASVVSGISEPRNTGWLLCSLRYPRKPIQMWPVTRKTL